MRHGEALDVIGGGDAGKRFGCVNRLVDCGSGSEQAIEYTANCLVTRYRASIQQRHFKRARPCDCLRVRSFGSRQTRLDITLDGRELGKEIEIRSKIAGLGQLAQSCRSDGEKRGRIRKTRKGR
jgi:hypothetical protein